MLQVDAYRVAPSFKYKVEKMQHMIRRAKYSLIKNLAAAAVGLLSLTGCDDQAASDREASSAPKQTAFSAAGRPWIDVKDGVAPAVWLASREVGRDVDAGDPGVASFRTLLEEADARFSEGPRMIANRAVQVQAMLAERGVIEAPREVIEGLVSVGQIGERAGFGETCQHYVNARMSSGSRQAALDALRRQPLPQSSGTHEK